MRTHRELVVTVNCAAPRGACSGRRSETPRVTGQQVSAGSRCQSHACPWSQRSIAQNARKHGRASGLFCFPVDIAVHPLRQKYPFAGTKKLLELH